VKNQTHFTPFIPSPWASVVLRPKLKAVVALSLCAMIAPMSAAFAQSSEPSVQSDPAPPAAVPSVVPNVGAANLNITPRRVIFEGSKRTEAVYIFNQGNATAVVDIALIDNIMLPSGEIVPVSSAQERGAVVAGPLARLHSARDLLLATPSRVTLAPGKGKTIRLRVSLPDGAATAGEYRTHLTVTTLPPASSGLTADAAASSRGELSFAINTVFGISIPLIVRNGGPTAGATFGAFAIDHDMQAVAGSETPRRVAVLSVPLRRTGTASVYGNIEVRVGKGKSAELIGLVRGIAVYPEIDQRDVRIPLVREPRHGEVLSITFLADDGKIGGELARGSYTAP
jgi:hypothetical protein